MPIGLLPKLTEPGVDVRLYRMCQVAGASVVQTGRGGRVVVSALHLTVDGV